MTPGGPVRELEPGETAHAAAAMLELRPHHGDVAAITAAMDAQRERGYRVAGSFEEGEESAAAVAGFRLSRSLAWGLHVYVDDISCLADRRLRGHSGRLMQWLIAEARANGCDSLHLDSGHAPARYDAHRLYLNQGLDIVAHHFAVQL